MNDRSCNARKDRAQEKSRKYFDFYVNLFLFRKCFFDVMLCVAISRSAQKLDVYHCWHGFHLFVDVDVEKISIPGEFDKVRLLLLQTSLKAFDVSKCSHLPIGQECEYVISLPGEGGTQSCVRSSVRYGTALMSLHAAYCFDAYVPQNFRV